MASGTLNFNQSASTGSYIDSKVVWSSTSNSSANTSSVTAKLYVRKGSTTTTLTVPTSGTWPYSLTVNGKNIPGTVHLSVLEDWVLVATVTINDISHNDDGTKSITISGSVSAPSGTNYAGHKTSGSGTATFDPISRASTITSVSNTTLGSSCSVKWTPASASFGYKLEFSLGGLTQTTDLIKPNRTTAYTYTGYTIPLSFADKLPSAKTGTMTVTLYTYNGGALIPFRATSSKTFTVTVPNNSSTQPAVSMSLAPVGSLPSAFAGLYIQGKTKVKATMSATAKYSASINSYSMKVYGTSYGSSDGYTSGYLSNYGTIPVYGYATDSRGYTGDTSSNITVLAYSKPKITAEVCGRCDEEGKLSEDGTYLKIKATRTYSAVNSNGVQKNFCQIRYRYKAASASSYSAWTTILDSGDLSTNTVETDALLGGVLFSKTSYVVQIQAVDSIGEYSEVTIDIPTESVHTHRTKNGMGLGKYCEGENLLDVAWDARFHGEVFIGDTGMTLKEYIMAVISEGG